MTSLAIHRVISLIRMIECQPPCLIGGNCPEEKAFYEVGRKGGKTGHQLRKQEALLQAQDPAIFPPPFALILGCLHRQMKRIDKREQIGEKDEEWSRKIQRRVSIHLQYLMPIVEKI